MTIEKKDWESIKKESEATIKNAEIVIAVNTALLQAAEKELRAITYKESSQAQTTNK